MNAGKNWPRRLKARPHFFIPYFGMLRVRPKLAVLHNLFFVVLAVSIYVSVVPVFTRHIEEERRRETTMLGRMFSAGLPVQAPDGAVPISFAAGPADRLGLSTDGQSYLHDHPGAVWQDGTNRLFKAASTAGRYERAILGSGARDAVYRQVRVSLFLVLASIYLLSIAVMELLIMPLYVYKPLQLMLEANEATLRDDRENEMVDEAFILNDEIGQIMDSRNATVRKLRQQEDFLASALRKLEEQDRLVSLGLLSTSVAHEFNTPLAVLQGSIEKLQETSRDPLTLERLARMLRVTQRLRKISEGLVDFARVRKRETEAVALKPIIDESWGLVAIDEKAGLVTLENEVRPGDCVVGNSDRLIQVFVNLLRNALLAVAEGGRIRVQSRAVNRGGHAWICCTVEDNGPGIPTHVLSSLFEAFVSTRLDARGTGLGLTVAEGIVTQHGGTITAANRPEGGASLEVLLPASEMP